MASGASNNPEGAGGMGPLRTVRCPQSNETLSVPERLFEGDRVRADFRGNEFALASLPSFYVTPTGYVFASRRTYAEFCAD